MKKNFYALLIILLSGCASTKQIGNLNMVSTRNINSNTEYVLLKSYMGASKKEIKKSKAKTLEDAVDQVVKSTPGGEYLTNAKVYITGNGYLAVEGDVWGTSKNVNYRGFQAGDRVQWTKLLKTYIGTIIELNDDKTCTVKRDSDQATVSIEYEDLTKIGDNDQ